MAVNTITVSGTSTTISNLSSGTTYYYTIQAFNGSTAGSVSSVQSNSTVASTSSTSSLVLINGRLFTNSNKAAVTSASVDVTSTISVKPRKPKSSISGGSAASISNTSPWTPLQMAQLYNFNPSYDGTGQCIGIFAVQSDEYNVNDVSTARTKAGLSGTVDIANISIDGTSNNANHSPGNSSVTEAGLDTQCIALAAPGAKIRVYWCAGTTASFISCLQYVTSDTTNNPSIFSISYAIPEDQLSTADFNSFQSALQDAANAGITVISANGDWGAIAWVSFSDNQCHVFMPAASQWCTAVGGTTLTVSNNAISNEVAWNENVNSTQSDASGGGVSRRIAKPTFQNSVTVPTHQQTGFAGRGVADVALCAAGQYAVWSQYSPDTRATVNQYYTIGGTSAAAPMFAGLIARTNQQKGTNVGYLNTKLYQISSSVFRDITSGNNKMFNSSIGYDCVSGYDVITGRGSPNGTSFANSF